MVGRSIANVQPVNGRAPTAVHVLEAADRLTVGLAEDEIMVNHRADRVPAQPVLSPSDHPSGLCQPGASTCPDRRGPARASDPPGRRGRRVRHSHHHRKVRGCTASVSPGAHRCPRRCVDHTPSPLPVRGSGGASVDYDPSPPEAKNTRRRLRAGGLFLLGDTHPRSAPTCAAPGAVLDPGRGCVTTLAYNSQPAPL